MRTRPLGQADGEQAARSSLEAFIARQPVFDRHRRTFGYELLFRSSLANVFDSRDADQASLRVIADGHLLFGMHQLTGGKPAFVNFTRDTLVRGYASVFPPEALIIEVGPEVSPDDAVVRVCHDLHRAGYSFALTDAVARDASHPLLPLADMIKVDVRRAGVGDAVAFAATCPKARLVAERIETAEEFDAACRAGYSFFQGYFLSRPVVLARPDVCAFKHTHVALLQEINRPVLDRERLAILLKNDAVVAYKFLRLTNSAAFGLRDRIRSISQALDLLGDVAVRRWVSIITLRTIVGDRPLELAVQSVVRANLCEALAPLAGLAARAEEVFLVGLFSLLDAIVGRPLAQLVDEIAVSRDVRLALLGEPNPLRDIYLCVMAYERADWGTLSRRARACGVDESRIPPLYLRSVEKATLLGSLDEPTSPE